MTHSLGYVGEGQKFTTIEVEGIESVSGGTSSLLIDGLSAGVTLSAHPLLLRGLTSSVGENVLTVAEVFSGHHFSDMTGGANSLTMPSAKDLVAAAVGVAVNDMFDLIVSNVGQVATLVLLADGTFKGAADGAVAVNATVHFRFVFTNVTPGDPGSEAYDVYVI